ncbi:hypothetical protein PILCRDRAFT_226626 [Piloderma croceum F 1598]|uniref:Uncharacterized protein n=1 Tax=Piloderma croceum (strain F 1598) TaxID=765440 RepID=A0A0C3FYX0_PILCF|nr:hypothetical protein PILCRDRAFT_226626 [Piloderma croceum F 1598]
MLTPLTPPAPVQIRNRPAIPPLADLFPVNAAPPTSLKSHPARVRYSNEISDPSGIFVSFDGNNNGTTARRPLGAPRQPLSAVSQNLPLAPTEPRIAPKNKGRNVANRKGGALKDLTGLNSRAAMVLKEKPKSSPKGKAKENEAVASGKEQDSVRKRVIEWEKERERLREMQRLEEFANERDDEHGDVSFTTTTTTSLHETEENIQVAKVAIRTPAQIVPIAPSFLDISTTQSDGIPSSMNDSGISSFKQSLKMSIDKGIRIVKSSTLAGRAVPGRSPFVEGIDEPEWNIRLSERQSWEIVPDAKTPHADVHQASRNQRTTEDTKMDNMALWMRNVDKVVEDARQKFDSASAGVPHPPLPIPPTSRSSSQNHTAQSSRLPRKALRASQIFSGQNTSSTSALTQDDALSVDKTLPALPHDDPNSVPGIIVTSTPSRPRRATVTSRSPEPLKKQVSFDIDTGSPSRRKEKSRSHGNLLRHIETIDRLELELQKEAMPPTSPRLSAVFDKSLFIAPPIGHTEDISENDDTTAYTRSKSLDFNHLQVKHHPPRELDGSPPVVLDTPNRRRIEGVYDRFLMATAGVKRGGRRNQSVSLSHVKDVPSTSPSPQHPNHHDIHRAFNTAQPMAPSVFNEEVKLPRSVDELGTVTRDPSPDVSHYKDDSNNTVALVRRALKAVVAGKAATRQLQ